MALSAASWCTWLGFELYLASLEAAKATSGLVVIAAYRIDPTLPWYCVTDARDACGWSVGVGKSSVSAISVSSSRVPRSIPDPSATFLIYKH